MSDWIYEPPRVTLAEQGQYVGAGRYWAKPIRKCIYLLNIDDFAPEVRAITKPLILRYAHKISARVYEITDRKFPDWPVTYEKFQIWELARTHQNDWQLYLDYDTLVHPDTMDFSQHLPRNTVGHHGNDVASNRWRYTREMLRDGRHIGSCNWFTMAWDLGIDIWRPLEDLTLAEAMAHINPTVNELNTVITADHLIDDFTCSQNIAKYGLRFTTALQLMKDVGYADPGFLWHQYTLTHEQKLNGYDAPVAFVDNTGHRMTRIEHRPGLKEMLQIWGISR